MGASGTLLTALVAAVPIVVLVPVMARRSGRPRYVIALVVAALATAAYELAIEVLDPPAARERFVLGFLLVGDAARWSSLATALLCLVGAAGLWWRRPWGRQLAIAYLVYLLASFLLWGVRGGAAGDLLGLVFWQLLVLPFLVFCLMFLIRDTKGYAR